jgi:hypothetical protein
MLLWASRWFAVERSTFERSFLYHHRKFCYGILPSLFCEVSEVPLSGAFAHPVRLLAVKEFVSEFASSTKERTDIKAWNGPVPALQILKI